MVQKYKKVLERHKLCQVFFEIGCEPPKKVYYYCECDMQTAKEFWPHKAVSLKKFGHSKKKPYLCTNRTRHASRRPANQGGAFLYRAMRYNKQPISINDQIAILKGRGLIFSDEQKAWPFCATALPLATEGTQEQRLFLCYIILRMSAC